MWKLGQHVLAISLSKLSKLAKQHAVWQQARCHHEANAVRYWPVYIVNVNVNTPASRSRVWVQGLRLPGVSRFQGLDLPLSLLLEAVERRERSGAFGQGKKPVHPLLAKPRTELSDRIKNQNTTKCTKWKLKNENVQNTLLSCGANRCQLAVWLTLLGFSVCCPNTAYF